MKYFKATIITIAFLVLIVSNVLTLTNSTVHDALYGLLNKLNIPQISVNSPSTREARLKKMVAKQAATLQKVKSVSSNISRRMVRVVSVNVTSIPAESIPIIGIGTILSVTAYDIASACETMTDLNELAMEIDGTAPSPETSTVCGQTLPSQEYLIEQLQEDYKAFSDALGATIYQMIH